MQMAVIKVVCKNLKNNPQCPHGPTLKFLRVQDSFKQEFYACSAYRDRKHCPFYHVCGEVFSENLQQIWAMERQRMLPNIDHAKLEVRLEKVKQASPKDRLYCHSCSQLDLTVRRAQHASHNVQTIISDSMLAHPSQLLKPKEGSKKEAQYLFADTTSKVIIENLERAGVSRVLCLGTPRVHEHIQAAAGDMQSLLLDFDHRYHSFWPREKFLWYNMFNRHVMSTCSKEPKHVLRKFLAAGGVGRVALVMDPPFGGHIDPLAATVQYFIRQVDNLIGKKGRKLGSPVRMFTNIVAKEFVLPRTEGYWLCKPCAKWASPENRHCVKCKACTSKDGRTYKHCDTCNCCVKPQWSHCFNCERCLPSPHTCSPLMSLSVAMLQDGRTYKHCDTCNCCVKPQWSHCFNCERCLPSPHTCSPLMSLSVAMLQDGRTYKHCDTCNCCVKPQWSHCFNCERCLPSPHTCSPLMSLSVAMLQDGRMYKHCDTCNCCVKPQWSHCFNCERCLPLPHTCSPLMSLSVAMLQDGRTYKHCDTCNCCVKPQWSHCFNCERCLPSPHTCSPLMSLTVAMLQDGRTYKHCDTCNCCVKPQWSHCYNCERCLPSPHTCSPLTEKEPCKKENITPRHKRMKIMKIKTKSKSVKRNIQNVMRNKKS
ncbi:rRNA N6-adenosine-methyltransferase ZCCHC4-like isoform X3 [Homalodisca vitripennis]|uniref:rRNA N6-adenosine-methyltransferase ZCCHC4-like isoform X3 n=1 Tax=Homalodisca vitripennis TaxID=197043 RepID=UPI001EEC2FE0|nr:rRNA N6-adenosine-methyltransferase ZCCHC4-like isoform X3 [Homalodisca vitripennis]